MAEEVKPEFIKKTQTALNKYIKKPPLTEKLLKKPPFRFLHDIVTSVIRETGFLEGVFTPEELVADNVKDRDSKVKFLTKLINAVKQATGNSLKAKPGKIVAGLEVDKTLELLQAIAKGVTLKSNGKKAAEANAKDKKKPKEPVEDNNKKNEKKDVKEKGKLKDSSPANSLEKQPSQENGTSSAEKKRSGSIGVEEERKRSKERSSAKKKENEETAGEAGEVDKKREGSAGPKENGVVVEEKKDGERRSGRRRESSAARVKENGEVTEEVKGGEDGERKSGRRRERSAARVKENGEVAEEGKGDGERRSGRRRGSSAARGKENGEVEEGTSGGDGERRSGRRREGSAARGKENGEAAEEGKADGERKSGRRRERSSAGGRGAQQETGGEEKEERSPPETAGQRRRNSGLLKSLSGEGPEEEGGEGHRRPQTRRAASRSSRGPLKAFSEKDGKSLELKEEDEGPSKKSGPSTLGSGEPAPPLRPPSALERPRTARRAPPSARPASGRPQSIRPPSAVPGAPRARDRGEVQQDINKDQAENEIKEVVVITENDKEEDKEDMVVVENPTLQLNEMENIRDDLSSAVEGALVDSILETQSELEKRKSNKTQVDIEWEGGKGRRSVAWEKECARLREGVQGLTRAAGPLGKLFDFLQEDVDLASRELAVWRKAGASFAHQLHAEQRLTDETLSRHRKKLSELETLIEEQHDAIRALKATILTNEKKIHSQIARLPAR